MKLLEQFLEIFNKQSKILVEVLEQKADGELFDVHDYIARCTLDMICGKKNNIYSLIDKHDLILFLLTKSNSLNVTPL